MLINPYITTCDRCTTRVVRRSQSAATGTRYRTITACIMISLGRRVRRRIVRQATLHVVARCAAFTYRMLRCVPAATRCRTCRIRTCYLFTRRTGHRATRLVSVRRSRSTTVTIPFRSSTCRTARCPGRGPLVRITYYART